MGFDLGVLAQLIGTINRLDDGEIFFTAETVPSAGSFLTSGLTNSGRTVESGHPIWGRIRSD